MDFDPRDRDDDARDVDMPWVEVTRETDPERDPKDAHDLGRHRDREDRERHTDPRELFVDGLKLPRSPERELVFDGDNRYELNGDDSRTLATIGAFRLVAESDFRGADEHGLEIRGPDWRHLRDGGLTDSVRLDTGDRAVTLTDRGQHLLETHRREGDGTRQQAFYAGVSRPRELSHDVQLYAAYLREEERLRQQGAEIHRVILEQELKREYQEWLQDGNRGRPDSDGRPDREAGEIQDWARNHDLPYFDASVHFPDLRIEYDINGNDRHEDVEVVTEHYRGAHAASVARSGFRCYGRGDRGGRSGGRGPFDPDVARGFV